MRFPRLGGIATVCLLCSGCLSVRMVWEQASPFYLGKWRYAEKVYSGMYYDRLWEGLLSSANGGLNQWPFEMLDKEKGKIKTEWVRTGDKRRKLEMRIDHVKDEEGRPGYLVSLRVLRQRTRELYTPLSREYTWRPYGQDEGMEELILARIQDEFREYSKEENADD